MNRDTSSTPAAPRWLARGAAIALLIAGIIHFSVVPQHYEHAPAHGIAMGVIGAVQVIWAAVFWLRPSRRTTLAGMLLAVGSLTLWAITRVLPTPFGHGPEMVDSSGVLTKTLELIAALALAGTLRTLPAPSTGRRLGQTALAVVVLAVVSGFVVYGAARAAQPLFPSLMAVEAHEDEGQTHEEGDEYPAQEHAVEQPADQQEAQEKPEHTEEQASPIEPASPTESATPTQTPAPPADTSSDDYDTYDYDY